jgi:hypothetical protein
LRIRHVNDSTLADVDTDDRSMGFAPKTLEAARDNLSAVIVEAHAVDQRPVRNQPKEPGRWIPGLRMRGYRANLNVTKSEGAQTQGHVCVLVESGGEPKRRRKRETQGRNARIRRWATICTHHGPDNRPTRGSDNHRCYSVGTLRLHAREDGSKEGAVER